LGTQCCQRASRLRESDSDYGEQFCCINSPDRAFGFSFNFAESPQASASWRESLKEAVEPANLRANRKYRARWRPDSSPRMVEGTDLRLSEIDDLPSGSRVLNATGVQENNFHRREGNTNRVIAGFEAPADLTPESLRATAADFVVEVIPGSKYPAASLENAGAKVVADTTVLAGEDRVH